MIEVFHIIFFILCVVGCTASTFYYIFVTKKRLDRKKLETERTDEEDGEEIITDENVINVFDSTIGMVPRGRYYPNRDYFIPLREKTDKLSPKKKMKAHTLVKRKYTIRRPGVYTREVDLSIVNPHVILNLNRENG